MNTWTKTVTSGVIAVAAVALVVAGVYALGASAPQAEPTPTVTAEPAAVFVGITENGLAAEQEAEAAAAEAVRIEAERVAAEAEAARIEAERVAAEQAAAEEAARQSQARGGDSGNNGGGAAPSAPIRCPAGSSANSNDGVNDTSCFPDICFSIAVPDPAHPECDVAFRP